MVMTFQLENLVIEKIHRNNVSSNKIIYELKSPRFHIYHAHINDLQERKWRAWFYRWCWRN